MKRINLISALAIAAMATLALSCVKEGDSAPKTREVSFDLSLDNPESKFSMTEGTGHVKAAWEVGDKVTVMWLDGSTKSEEFEVTAVSADGKNATFTNASSAMPEDCTIGVYYPSRPVDGSIYEFNLDSSALPDDAWDLAHAGENLVYGASGITVSGSVVPAISLKQKSSFLYIKKGTAITGLKAGRIVITRSGLHYQFYGRYDSSEMTSYTYANSCNVNVTTAGEIPYDFYIPFIADGTNQSPSITITQGDVNLVLKDFGEKALQPGKIYDISGSLY